MIKFEKIFLHADRESYCCEAAGRALGYLHQSTDGLYSFFPNHLIGDKWPSFILKEVAFKLEALNESIIQKLLAQANEDVPEFTD